MLKPQIRLMKRQIASLLCLLPGAESTLFTYTESSGGCSGRLAEALAALLIMSYPYACQSSSGLERFSVGFSAAGLLPTPANLLIRSHLVCLF